MASEIKHYILVHSHLKEHSEEKTASNIFELLAVGETHINFILFLDITTQYTVGEPPEECQTAEVLRRRTMKIMNVEVMCKYPSI